MSLLGKIWNRLRGKQVGKKRTRRLFLEPLESRELLFVDWTISKSGPTDILAGATNVMYTITIDNDGDEAATNVNLSDVIPGLTTFVDFTQDAGPTFDIIKPVLGSTGEAASASIASFDADASATFTVTVNVDSNAAQSGPTAFTNTATVSSDQDFASDGETTNVTGLADVQITGFTDAPDPVGAGSNITYTLTLFNDGPSDAADEHWGTDALTNATFVSLDLSGAPGWVAEPTNPAVGGTAPIGAFTTNFVAGTTPVFKYTVKVNPGTSVGTIITSSVIVGSLGNTSDPNTGNNKTTANNPPTPPPAETTVSLVPDADLSITKTDGATTEIPGTPITYTIVVSNAGPTAVTGATVTDTFPTDLTDVEYTSIGDGGATGNPVPRFGNISDLVDLPVGGSITYTVTANIKSDTTATTLVNTATITPPQGVNDPGPGPNTATDTDTLTPTANLSITKTDGVTTAVPGNSVTYTITVSNPGPSAVTGATVADAFDAKFTSLNLDSVTPAGGASSPATTGTFASPFSDTINLPANSSITYTITGTISPAATGNLSNTATVDSPNGVTDPSGNNSATDTDTLTPTADLSITKDDGVTSVNAGGTVQYTIVVSNVGGPSTITGATVTDTFSNKYSSLNLVNVQVTGGATSSKTTGAFTSPFTDTVTLPTGSTITYTIGATVSLGATGTLDNTATVTAPQGAIDNPTANNSESDNDTTIIAAPNPDLIVTKSDSPDINVTAGTNLTYTINVQNNGGQPASDVRVFDLVPAGTTFVSIAQPQAQTGWVLSTPTAQNQGLVARKAAGMAATETATFTMVVKVNSSTASGTIITNNANATVTGGIAEANTANNTGTATTTVQTQANLGVTKTDSPDPVVVGTELTYSMVVTTAGPSDAQVVKLTDALPAGTTFVSLTTPPGWTATTPQVGSGGTVTVTKDTSLAAGSGSATFTLVVLVGASFTDGQTISNTAVVSSNTPEPAPDTTSNSATQTTTVIVEQDFGDAPDTYGTVLPGGARHILSTGLQMGANVDPETNGLASADALGDDANATDDEDGVLLATQLLAGRDAVAIVNSSGVGLLDAWIDFDKSGTFEADERIATGAAMVAGSNPVAFVVPADAAIGGTFARFRLSTAGVALPTGAAPDGEVEDYSVAIAAVTPGTVGIVPNPEAPGENMLLINGTANADSVSVKQLKTHLLRVQVGMNGKTYGPFNMSNFRQIVAYAGAGNDGVQVNVGRPSTLRGEAGNDRLTAASGFDVIYGGPDNDTMNGGPGDDLMYGGEGNDTMNGGDGNDVLLGEGGNDTLTGGKNRDLLIGGPGVDRLNGEAGDDILIGGTTAHDNNRVALAQIMAIWTSRDSFPTRLSKLAPFINIGTVTDDGSRDRLDGGTATTERDWYVDYLMADASANFSTKQDQRN